MKLKVLCRSHLRGVKKVLKIFILKCYWLPRVINIQLYRTGKVFCQLIYFLTSHTSAAVSWMSVPVSWVWYTKHRQKMWMRQACWKLNSLAVSITAFASCSPHARWMVRLLASHTRNANRWLLSDGTIKLNTRKVTPWVTICWQVVACLNMYNTFFCSRQSFLRTNYFFHSSFC